jgi:hypothetical protein
MIETAHPSDGPKLRRLAELLCDFSAGRPAPREPLLPLVENLMVCCRDDCSADGAEGGLDRLLGIADHRLGRDRVAEAAMAEIMAALGGPHYPVRPDGASR